MAKANHNQKVNKDHSEKNRNGSPKPTSAFSVQKGQEMEITITGLGSAGEGVGRFKDIAVFVPGALPGETVRAAAAFIKKSFIVGFPGPGRTGLPGLRSLRRLPAAASVLRGGAERKMGAGKSRAGTDWASS